MSLFSAVYSSTALPALETECLEAGDPLGGVGVPLPPPPPLPLFEDDDDDEPGGDGGFDGTP